MKKNPTLLGRLSLTGALLAATTGIVSAEEFNFSGRLEAGDEQLESDEFVDTYPNINVQAGSLVTIDLRSEDFDAYLIAELPGGEDQLDNDDNPDGDETHSRLKFIARESGAITILATSFSSDESGAYTLNVSTQPAQEVARETGNLQSGDQVSLKGGEFADTLNLPLEAGKQYVVTVNAQEFDCYLSLHFADGTVLYNDDGVYPDSSDVTFTAVDSGSVKAVVSSYEPGETGSYTVTMHATGSTPSSGTPPASVGGKRGIK